MPSCCTAVSHSEESAWATAIVHAKDGYSSDGHS